MRQKTKKLEGGYRTSKEDLILQRLAKAFNDSKDSLEERLESFTKYVRRQALTRFLVQSELFTRIIHVEGSIIECGVFRGVSLFGWLHLSSILEPTNWRRLIYGFDTFCGFSHVSDKDLGRESAKVREGAYSNNSYEEIVALGNVHDDNRFLGHISKISLIKGDAVETIPQFMKDNPHIVVALLFLDFDLYNPTKIALENFLPRMPKGSLLVFDELNHPLWPGETLAVLETIGLRNLKIERFSYYPNISFAEIN